MINKLTLGLPLLVVVLFVLYTNNNIVAPTPGALVVTEDREVKQLFVNDVVVEATVLTTVTSRVQGLSGLEFLPEQAGYFFVFDNLGYHGIWMPDMLLDIDIIWLDKDLRVVYLAENITPDTYPEVFRSDRLALYVLEVNAGMAKKWGIEIGSEFRWTE